MAAESLRDPAVVVAARCGARPGSMALRAADRTLSAARPWADSDEAQWGEDESRTRSGTDSPMAFLPWFR